MIEGLLSQVWYWFNSIETYTLTAAIAVYLLKNRKIDSNLLYLMVGYLFLIVADFHPFFLVFILLGFVLAYKGEILNKLKPYFLYSAGFYYLYLVGAAGVVYFAITGDFTVPIHHIINGFFTFADTSLSAIPAILMPAWLAMSGDFGKDRRVMIFFFTAALFTRSLLPVNYQFTTNLPEPGYARTDKVMLVVLDGTRLDKFEQANKPFLDELASKGVLYVDGATSMYRTKTEPQHATMLTGAPPSVHGVWSNLFFGGIKIDAIPRHVNTCLYGTVHLNDLIGKDWRVKSLFNPSAFNLEKGDMEVMEHALADIRENKCQFYLVQLSYTDQMSHAYGSESENYLQGIEKTDNWLGRFFGRFNYTDFTIIILADHGQAGQDHGFAVFNSEVEVPLILYGKGIKQGVRLTEVPSIIDIPETISYLLNIPYPEKAQGRVLLEGISP